MGATGSIGKQETAPVKQHVNLINTVDNLVLFVAMNEPHIAIKLAVGYNQWKHMNDHPLIIYIKIE